jgi:hypothetical protein
MDSREAREALGAMQGATTKFGETFDCPPWRHAVFGTVMGALVLSVSLPEPWHWGLFALAMLSLIPIVRSDRRRNGAFVNGWRVGRTLPVTILVALFMGGMMMLSISGRHDPVPSPRGMIAALLAFGGGMLFSIVWKRIYMAELGKSTAQ